MKKLLVFVLLILSFEYANSQRIYGFVENYFVSTDLSDGSRDTLITFPGNPWINLGFRATVDKYNGRYFFGGSLPGHQGQFHIIDLIDLTIESYSYYPENMEYDFIRNKILYEKRGNFYSINLGTMELTNLGVVDTGNSITYGQIRTYKPQSQQYIYSDYKDGPMGAPYFLVIDAQTGELLCEKKFEEYNGYYYASGGYVTNNLTGDIIGHHNGRYGIISPCDGTMTKLSQIPDYKSHLNNQMAIYDHTNNTYIIPYYSTNNNDRYKIAIVDVYNDEILQTMSQPWEGKMNLQQIYDQPLPLLLNINDTLFVPKGDIHNWYVDGEFIASTTENYWVPNQNGDYSCEVDYKEYSSTSAVENVDNISSVEDNIGFNISYYPNPANNLLFIKDELSEIITLEITDISGLKLYSDSYDNHNSNILTIDISSLNKGIYNLLIKTNTGVISKKLIKL